MTNLLLLVNELRYTCGVTNHILHLSSGLSLSGEAKVWIITGGGNGVNRFAGMDVNIITDERFLHSNRSFSGHVSAISFLVKFIRENNIDIVHSHYHYGAAIARRASKLCKIPAIQTNHGLLPEMGRLKHFNADKYVAINEHILEHLLSKKIAAEKDIYFIRCGIPVEKELPHKSDSQIRVIAASRFVEGKGVDTFIKAASLVNSKGSINASFTLAGEGVLEEELRALDNKLNAGVKFVGRILDMYTLLREAHILVFPGVSDNEGFPAIITEAGATGCVLVTSRFNAAGNILIDGENCRMFAPNDEKELSDILTECITNYEKMKPLAANLYEKIKKEYDLQTMIDKHLLMYKECLAV